MSPLTKALPLLLALLLTCTAASSQTTSTAPTPAPASVPLIHSTDLLYPPDDPDDWFDLAAVYAVPEFDLKCVILDQGEKQKDRPGRTPVSMLNKLTGRQVPAAVGLSRKLRSPDDKALDEPAEFQSGVESILRVLRDSPTSVSISVVGSARDVAAAFNREPDLLRQKVGRIYVFAGEACHPSFIEWNVSMDPLAYASLMRSGLPICWIPCFDGGDFRNHGNSSWWMTTQSQLLAKASEPLLQFFIVATQSDATSYPLQFIEEPVQPARKDKLFATPRNMWGGALLGILAGRTCVRQGDGYVFTPAAPNSTPAIPRSSDLFEFREVTATFSDRGVVQYDPPAGGQKMLRFHVKNMPAYGPAMTNATAELLGPLRTVGKESEGQ